MKKCHEADKLFIDHSKLIGNINVPVLLIGDSAFRLSQFLMKPYPFTTNQPPMEKVFNYKLSKCRRVIENAFGQLKARFRKLGKGLEVAPWNWNKIIKACCLLHNFLKNEEDEVPSFWGQEAERRVQREQPETRTLINNNNVNGKRIRDVIASSFGKIHLTLFL